MIILFFKNKSIKSSHDATILKLQEIINSLYQKQKQLNEKVLISDEYRSNYTKDMKSLGDEVVELQKVFINIITNKN